MCDEVDASAMYSRRPRRARKSYTCEACSEPIPVGSKHVAHSGLQDGEWWTIRQCVRCDAITTAIIARSTEVVELHLDCGETWEDAFGECPPEVQALAFALPGDP